MRIRTVPGRKLLIATIGVAAVSYVACTPQPPPQTTGNLMPPQAAPDGGPMAVPTGPGTETPPTSGNLVAPPPAPSAPNGK